MLEKSTPLSKSAPAADSSSTSSPNASEKGLLSDQLPLHVAHHLRIMAELTLEGGELGLACEAYEKALEIPHIKEHREKRVELLEQLLCAKRALLAKHAETVTDVSSIHGGHESTQQVALPWALRTGHWAGRP